MARGVERPTAAQLVEFLPVVYFRLLLAESGLPLPVTYRRLLADGTHTPLIPFSSEAIWNELVTFAKSEIAIGIKVKNCWQSQDAVLNLVLQTNC